MTLSYNAIGIQMAKQEREAAIKEAVEQTIKKLAIKVLKMGILSDSDIAEIYQVSIEYELNLKKELNL